MAGVNPYSGYYDAQGNPLRIQGGGHSPNEVYYNKYGVKLGANAYRGVYQKYDRIYSDIAGHRSKLVSTSTSLGRQREQLTTQRRKVSSEISRLEKLKRTSDIQTRMKIQKQIMALKRQRAKYGEAFSRISSKEQEISDAQKNLEDYRVKVKRYEGKQFNLTMKDYNPETLQGLIFTKIRKRKTPRTKSMKVTVEKYNTDTKQWETDQTIGTRNTKVERVVKTWDSKPYYRVSKVSYGGSGGKTLWDIYGSETADADAGEIKVEAEEDETPKYVPTSIPVTSILHSSNQKNINIMRDVSSGSFGGNLNIKGGEGTRLMKSTTALPSDLPFTTEYYTTRGYTYSEASNLAGKNLKGWSDKLSKGQPSEFDMIKEGGDLLSKKDLTAEFQKVDQSFSTNLTNVTSTITQIEKADPNTYYNITTSSGDIIKDMPQPEALRYFKKQKANMESSYTSFQSDWSSYKKDVDDKWASGKRPYEWHDEVYWLKTEPRTSSVDKAEYWLKEQDDGNLWASAGLRGANLLSDDPLHEFKKSIGWGSSGSAVVTLDGKGRINTGQRSKDIDHYARAMEKLDIPLEKGDTLGYLGTAYTSPFATTGIAVATAVATGGASGFIIGRLSYTAPSLAKAFVVGEMVVGSAFIGMEVGRVGEIYMKDPDQGFTEAVLSGTRIIGGFAGYKAGRQWGMGRGWRSGWRASIKSGIKDGYLEVYDMKFDELGNVDKSKSQIKALYGQDAKDYGRFILKMESYGTKAWKGLKGIKTKPQRIIDLDTSVETMKDTPTSFRRAVGGQMKHYKSELFGSPSERSQTLIEVKPSSHDLDMGFWRYARGKDVYKYYSGKLLSGSQYGENLADVKPMPKVGDLATPFGARVKPTIKGYFKIGNEVFLLDQMQLTESGMRHYHSSLDLAHSGRYKDTGRGMKIMEDLWIQGVKSGQLKGIKAYKTGVNLGRYLEMGEIYQNMPKAMDPKLAGLVYTTNPSTSMRDWPDLAYKKIAPASYQEKVNQRTLQMLVGAKGVKTTPFSDKGMMFMRADYPTATQTYYVGGGLPNITRFDTVSQPSTFYNNTSFIRLYLKSPAFSTKSMEWYPYMGSRGTPIGKTSSLSRSVSLSISPSSYISPSRSKSISPSRSVSPSISLSPSIVKSISPSINPSPYPSPSKSLSPSPSISILPSPSPSPSPSISISPSPSPSKSLSPSPSPSISILPH